VIQHPSNSPSTPGFWQPHRNRHGNTSYTSPCTWDEQHTHRALIRHLYVLLPTLTLTGHQQPHRLEMILRGRALLAQLLTLCKSLESPGPDQIHAKYFGCLWKMLVPGRDRALPSQGQAWADTLAIWLDPTGGYSEGGIHCGDLDKYQIWADK